MPTLQFNAHPNLTLLALGCIGFLCVFLYHASRGAKPQPNMPLPPGPKGSHLIALPFAQNHRVLADLSSLYGPVITLDRGATPVVVVTSQEAAIEIMEKQGSSLIDRPHWTAASDILSGGMRLLLQSSGSQFRKGRKALHTHLQNSSAKEYEPVQMQYAKNFILDTMREPENHMTHAQTYAASVIMSITYGRTSRTSHSDPEIIQVLRSLRRIGEVIRPGAYLLDTFPVLRYVPGYLRTLRMWHREELTLFKEQLNVVRRAVATGDAQPSFSQYLIENQTELELSDEEEAYLAGSMFGAGSSTTASAINIFTMAAASFPQDQARVQQELDTVIGRDRAPTFADQEFLPQTMAFTLETMRWRPVSDLGFPHRAGKDIVWRDCVIPAGSTVIGNPWQISRDPTMFVDGDKFNPQRWLGPNNKIREDLKYFGFGFGRRVCPGQYVAQRSIFINAALMLWAFNIMEKPSSPIDVLAFTSDAGGARPRPFDVNFGLRMDEVKVKEILDGYGNGL